MRMSFGSAIRGEAIGGLSSQVALPVGGLIPAPPAPPGPPNGATIYDQLPSWTLAAGAYFYSANIDTLLYFGANQFSNQGSIFLTLDAEFGGALRIAPYYTIQTVQNDGLIVARGVGPILNNIELFNEFRSFTNTGEIYALSDTGFARILQSYDSFVTVTNSGLLAAYSATQGALVVNLPNGGQLRNLAGGEILAEGANAAAVVFGSSSVDYDVEVENAGRIEARSLGNGGPSYGVVFSLGGTIDNSGLIRADIALSMNGTLINSGTVEGIVAIEGRDFVLVDNQASGIIRGDILGGTREDDIRNAGMIEGNVALAGGNDHFVNSGAGTVSGIVDLGFGADVYVGFAGVDRVAGDNGDDRIDGGGGNDLLIGGNGDDLLIGGAGNDGLYGERGNDVIVTSGADVAVGGGEDDRIVLGDYSFAFVSGGDGIDRLVLPAGARRIDLSAALATGRIEGFEIVELGGGQEIVVRAPDVAAMSGGEELRIEGSATDTVDLVGAWVGNGSVAIDGTVYDRYQLDGHAVLVEQGLAVHLMAAPPAGIGGLDAIAEGGAALAPGVKSGLDLTPDTLFVSYFEIYEPTLIYDGETWYTQGSAPAVYAFRDSAVLTNLGTLLATNPVEADAIAIDFINLTRVFNDGVIRAISTGQVQRPVPDYFPSNMEGAYAVKGGVSLVNRGLIETYSVNGMAAGTGQLQVTPEGLGIPTAYSVQSYVASVDNQGTILSRSDRSYAFGTVGSAEMTNSGDIFALGWRGAIGVTMGGTVDNAGSIAAAILDGGPGESIGVLVLYGRSTGSDPSALVANSGTISADIAVQVIGYTTSLTLHNEGDIIGDIESSVGADRIENAGTIAGDIRMGDGNDLYLGGGLTIGDIFGEGGNDQLAGGERGDRLFGGAGDDRLQGGGGTDYLDGGDGSDIFVFTAAADSTGIALRSDGRKLLPDTIDHFDSGTDVIDLSAVDAVAGGETNEAFAFIGTGAFTHQAGELRYEMVDGRAYVSGDVNGDGLADFVLVVDSPSLQAGDFIL